MNSAGMLVTADVWFKRDVEDTEVHAALERGLRKSGMRVIERTRHDFSPQGMTAIWLLSESHCSVHTYPEWNYISIDCYTCGDEGKPEDAIWAALDDLPETAWLNIRKQLRGVR